MTNRRLKVPDPRLWVLAALTWIQADAAAQFVWQTFNAPIGRETIVMGIDGGNLVGSFYDGPTNSPVLRSFLYSTGTWTYLDAPSAFYTDAKDISGNKIVGAYRTGDPNSGTPPQHHGFIYENGNWTTLSENGAEAYGIDGNNIVGSNGSSFLYDGSQYSFLNSPFQSGPSAGSGATGISGNTIVGYAWGTNPENGYIKNGSNLTLLQMPGAHVTHPDDIQGSNVVGYVYMDNTYSSAKGFLYDGSSWTLLEMPGAVSTQAYGIDGQTIVGGYLDTQGNYNGFILTIPEPNAPSLLAFGLGVFFRPRRKQDRRQDED